MSKFEVFLIVVALVNVGVVLELVRRRNLLEGYALLWLSVGVAGIAYVAAREVVDRAAEAIGISNGVSLVLGAAVVFLLFVCMSLSLHISRLEARTEVLAEEVAMLHGVREPEPEPKPVTAPARAPPPERAPPGRRGAHPDARPVARPIRRSWRRAPARGRPAAAPACRRPP